MGMPIKCWKLVSTKPKEMAETSAPMPSIKKMFLGLGLGNMTLESSNQDVVKYTPLSIIS
ncbi:hypothetical protein SAMN04488029_1239 [Reichenbachiella faecimaris]|uniref:Uncharacterized protein n=1 Tax=Reichenbachiella faecimaris TaxID=692418 RepID=A0A1W2G870_REIFA|nr:hypothetical protein SAMN04488029_1239 [Reichenbachiella faecimaris]